MSLSSQSQTQMDHRLAFLLETVALEAAHLQGTGERLFA